jgi:hypothetical protein
MREYDIGLELNQLGSQLWEAFRLKLRVPIFKTHILPFHIAKISLRLPAAAGWRVTESQSGTPSLPVAALLPQPQTMRM